MTASPTPDLDRLADLAEQAQRSFESARATIPEAVVDPSAPILYFGDAQAYATSPIRVATVGLNPSDQEFPPADPYGRFPGIDGIHDGDTDRYLEALSGYFEARPYWRWFSSLEPVLDGLGVSFRAGSGGRAVHTDLCSPVATSPTWSRLADRQRAHLRATGRSLWHDLIAALRPHVLVASVARRHLKDLPFPALGDWEELVTFDKPRRPYVVKVRRHDLDGDPLLVLFGPAMQTPFGAASKAERHEAGRRAAELLAPSAPSGAGRQVT